MRCAKFGGVLLAVLLAGCLLSLHYLSRCVSRTTAELAAARAFAEQEEFDRAVSAARDAEASWTRARTFLGSVLRHDESDDLSYSFARLPDYATPDSADEFLACCAELTARLRHILDMERPLVYNFL